MMPDFPEKWEGLPWTWFSRCTENAGQHRMMTLVEGGSMARYITLVRENVGFGGRVIELGGYHGGSIATLALATPHKGIHYTSVESFSGNLDGTVDGHPLPALNTYLDNLKAKWPFLNIGVVQLPGQFAVVKFPDESIDFLFVDGGHDETSVTRDITQWLPKVRTGGIIAGDDYCWEGVQTSVKKLLPSHKNADGIWWVNKE